MFRLFLVKGAIVFVATAIPVAAQQPAAPVAGTSATVAAPATYVPKADLAEVVKKSAAGERPASDALVKMAPNKQNTVHVNIGHRTKAGAATVGGPGHPDLTEIWYITEGTGTVLTGGRIAGGAERGPIENGVNQRVTVGDVIVIPPNTPHTFSGIESDLLVFLNIRIGPGK